MATQTDILNAALVLIGEDAQTDPASAAPGRALVPIYDGELDSLLEEHPWNFAEGTANLAVASGETHPKYSTVFKLPTDYLTVRDVVRGDEDTEIYYLIAQGRLFCDEASISIIYTRRVTAVNEMPPTFRSALAHRLAMRVAPKFSSKYDKRDAAEALRTAKTTDAQGGGREKPRRPQLFRDARRW